MYLFSNPSKKMADKESTELKAGHAPATKVGGMRVVQHKPTKDEKPEAAKMTDEDKGRFK